MKIKTRLSILILVIVLVPVSALLAISLYHYYSSPERFLIKGYREIRALGGIDLSESTWNEIENRLYGVPQGVEVSVFYDGKILSSNIPDLPSGMEVSENEVFDFVQSTSSEYEYQFQKIYVPEKRAIRKLLYSGKPRRRMNGVLFITRTRISASRRQGWIERRFALAGIIVTTLFEAVAIIIIYQISHTLFSSVTFVEKTVQNIADGGIDKRIDSSAVSKKADEISHLVDNLEKMRLALKDNELRRQRFIMGISHDLRTPVALIKGYTEAITDGVVNDMDSVKKSLGIIHTKASVLENLINNLIDYVKLNGNEWLLSLEDTLIKPVLDDFAGVMVSSAGFYRRNITAGINISENLSIPLDKNLFERVMENLFSNAVRYSSEGDSISLCAEENDSCIKIKFSDTGTGISEKELPHIFDLFYKGSASRRENGNGIGLSVVKTVIDAMNWSIDVASSPGKGTEFTITVPLSQEKTE